MNAWSTWQRRSCLGPSQTWWCAGLRIIHSFRFCVLVCVFSFRTTANWIAQPTAGPGPGVQYKLRRGYQATASTTAISQAGPADLYSGPSSLHPAGQQQPRSAGRGHAELLGRAAVLPAAGPQPDDGSAPQGPGTRALPLQRGGAVGPRPASQPRLLSSCRNLVPGRRWVLLQGTWCDESGAGLTDVWTFLCHRMDCRICRRGGTAGQGTERASRHPGTARPPGGGGGPEPGGL